MREASDADLDGKLAVVQRELTSSADEHAVVSAGCAPAL